MISLQELFTEKEVIPGGISSGMSLTDIAKKYAGDYYDYRNVLEVVKAQIKKGIKVELEHTNNKMVAAEIARDHVAEDLHYYDKLDKAKLEGLEDPKDNPCWRGYEPVGTKKKNGKTVPNCVPIKERFKAEGDVNYNAIMGYFDNIYDLNDKIKAAYDIVGAVPKMKWTEISLRDFVSDAVLDMDYDEMKDVQARLNIDPHNSVDEMHGMAHDDHDEHHKLRADYEAEGYCPACLAEYLKENWNNLEEAKYQGRTVTLNKPFLTPDGPKKRSVYVKNAKGNVVKVNFGQKGVAIKKHLPKHRKSYRARHHCDNPGPKWKANYWSCKAW